VRQFLLAVGSALLLVLAFPNCNQPWCAWIALIPWLAGLRRWRGRQAFGWSYLIGLLFFLGSGWWLIHVTLLGWILLCAYLAAYFGAFGWLVTRLPASRFRLLTVPAVWVALEYLRSHPASLLAGFGWNLLAYSQTPVPALIQIAALTGAWGVSFLVVLVNVALLESVSAKPPQAVRPILIAAGCVVLAARYGYGQLGRQAPAPSLTVAVAQGNIPQEEKWDEASKDSIFQHYERLTRQAANGGPSLIVWPETAVPGYLGLDPAVTERVAGLAQAVQAPLLVGAPMAVSRDGVWEMTNSAALVDPSGSIVARYDKLHLVPFGEFIPGERSLPWLRRVLPPIGDFIPGREPVVFQVPGVDGRPVPFSVLICFEDIFPGMARDFVRRGARLLITITNDAWFGNTGAAYQHAQASAFRAVELHVPMVRAANTGWSGCIDARGRWGDRVRVFSEGLAVCQVSPGEAGTVYQRWGDWFAGLCLLGTAAGLLASLRRRLASGG